MASLAPARAKVRAISLPIPLAAPVTTATLSLRCISLISMRSSFPVSREEGIDRRQTLGLIKQGCVAAVRDGDVLNIRLLADHARHRRGAEQIGGRSAYHQHRHALDLRVQRPQIAGGSRWIRKGLADFWIHVGDGDTGRILAVAAMSVVEPILIGQP